MNKKILLLTFIASFALNDGHAQDNIGLRFVFGTVHPRGEYNAFLMPNKLDENAVFVPNWGFIGSYERYFYKKRWAVKVAQGAYSDCARLFAGHTHLGLRLNILANSPRHSLEVGFGPTLVYRQSWYRFDGYRQETRLLKNSGNWQWNFVWYGGEIEYDYKITKNTDLTLNVIPGYPQFYTFGLGARYWIRPIKNDRMIE